MIRTLIVEDDPVVAEVNRGYLERMTGFVVVGTAETGKAALAAVSGMDVDLVLLDFHLPDIDGIEVCRALRAGHRDPVDIIAVTAARNVETVHSALAHGVVQYLIKPYKFSMFKDKLTRYAEYHRSLSRNGTFIQEEVDQALRDVCGTSHPTVPKGMSEPTMRKVFALIGDTDDAWSAADVAEATGLARVTARRYLDELHRQGLLDIELRYGGPGRPEHYYRWRKRP